MCNRQIDNRLLTFGFDSGLYKGNLLLYDVETKSTWSQLGGRALEGDLQGTYMNSFPTLQTTWKHWSSLYPETTVAQPEGRRIYPYKYPPSVDVGDEILGLIVKRNQTVKVYPLFELRKAESPYRDEVGGQEIMVHYDERGPSAWITGPDGELQSSTIATGVACMAFQLRAEVYFHQPHEDRESQEDRGIEPKPATPR